MKLQELSRKHLRHKGLGSIESHQEIAHGVDCKATKGYLRIRAYNQGVLRIQISDTPDFDDLSYAVVTEPVVDDPVIIDKPNSLELATGALLISIDKNSSGISIYNQAGQLLSEDCPGLGVSFMGDSKSVYKSMQKGERFIGLGEKTGNLDRKGSGYVNRNTDSFGYGVEADPLYCSIPFYIGLHNQIAYGIFLDNTYETHFNFGASNDRFSSFTVRGGDLNYYFIYAETVAEIISSYTTLTGTTPLPPLWGLGYQQCRYSYYPADEVYGLARTFREKSIPADAIVLDIHYMEAYKIFSWDLERFPDPEKMINDLKDQGFNVVVMCDPGIKIEDEYQAYQEGLEKGLFLKYPDGKCYSGQVWPGWCHFPDFTNPETRKWWGEKLQAYAKMGVKGYWNDMNEIATWGQKLPELIEFDFEGEGGSACRGRNVYGLLMSKSTYEGAKRNLDNERPFNLTRAGYCGVQRYAAVWTGDNVSTDEHMLLGVRLVNSLGLAGIAYSGYDVGGFVGEASGALFARWISIGTFSPFFRGHTMINSKDSEPWSFGEEVEDISRNYLNLRYRLLPYIYSLFYESSTIGLPVARTLAIDYPFDQQVYNARYQNQYLFGPSILVAPVESYKEMTRIYLPEGKWYNFHSEKIHNGPCECYVESPLTHLPLFIKAGGIIPMQSQVQSTQEPPEPVLHLHIYGGESGDFKYYEDDGITYGYEDGTFYTRNISLNHKNRTIKIGAVTGGWETRFSQIKCYLHKFQDTEQVKLSDGTIKMEDETLTFLPAISRFDPLGSETLEYELLVKSFVIQNSTDEISITY